MTRTRTTVSTPADFDSAGMNAGNQLRTSSDANNKKDLPASCPDVPKAMSEPWELSSHERADSPSVSKSARRRFLMESEDTRDRFDGQLLPSYSQRSVRGVDSIETRSLSLSDSSEERLYGNDDSSDDTLVDSLCKSSMMLSEHHRASHTVPKRLAFDYKYAHGRKTPFASDHSRSIDDGFGTASTKDSLSLSTSHDTQVDDDNNGDDSSYELDGDNTVSVVTATDHEREYVDSQTSNRQGDSNEDTAFDALENEYLSRNAAAANSYDTADSKPCDDMGVFTRAFDRVLGCFDVIDLDMVPRKIPSKWKYSPEMASSHCRSASFDHLDIVDTRSSDDEASNLPDAQEDRASTAHKDDAPIVAFESWRDGHVSLADDSSSDGSFGSAMDSAVANRSRQARHDADHGHRRHCHRHRRQCV